MTIPLDRLYDFIERIIKKVYNDHVVIYRFWPHGSKNLIDFRPASPISFEQVVCSPKLLCADQEPLMFDFYQDKSPFIDHMPFDDLVHKYGLSHWLQVTNFKGYFFDSPGPFLLLHSEKRSSQVEQYLAHDYRPVFYWSHALIALDWFRYANHVTQIKNISSIFLIYNRAWSGTREYRLKFSELIISKELKNFCKINFNPIEPELGVHYNQYTFSNVKWRPTFSLDQHFPATTAQSWSSADFDINDYESTDIEVILETLFDDTRLHITEKTLRPIACDQPFILIAPHGSLEYLRNYGFQTFDSVWNESYDLEPDPEKRLIAVLDLMKEISQWDTCTRKKKMSQAREISAYNKKYFFSGKFFEIVVQELIDNLEISLSQEIDKAKISKYLQEWKNFVAYQEVQDFLKHDDNNIGKYYFPNHECATNIIHHLEKSLTR